MKKTQYTILALAVLLSAGCQQTRVDEPEGEYISFGTAMTGAKETTRSGAGSTMIDSDSELQAQPFGIYGYKSVDDKSNFVNVFSTTAAQKVYFTTTAITGQANANTWTYDDRQKWERAMHYRFRAYWPYTANVNVASTANFLAVEYHNIEDYDLLLAYSTRCPLTDAAGVGRVPMEFKHALAGLRFKFRFKEDEKFTNITDYATGLYVQGLIPSGTVIYGEAQETDTPETMRWNISTGNYDSTTKFYNWTGSEKFGVGATTANKTIATAFDNDKMVFIVPQTLSETEKHNGEDVVVRPSYVYFTTQSGGSTVQKALIPTTRLESGKIYTYTLVVNGSSVTLNVDIEDWTETQANMDIYF